MTIVLFYYLKDFMSSSTIIDEFKMDIDMASDLRLNNSMFMQLLEIVTRAFSCDRPQPSFRRYL